MKATFLALGVLICTTSLAQEIHDLRTVNGITVDLGPVRAWFAKDKDTRGERPMKHWKQLRVTEAKEQMGTWTKCAVMTEDGLKVELLIGNLPPEVKAFFQTMDQQYQAIVRWRGIIESDTRKIRQLDGSIPTLAGGDPRWVDAVMAQRSQLEAWKAKVGTAKEELAKSEAAYDDALSRAAEKITVLAMVTGRKYANIDIWDCGQKKL
jgi:hypothetical protein